MLYLWSERPKHLLILSSQIFLKMAQRSNPVPINKSLSSENVCKAKEDRVRNTNNSSKFKQRNDNGNTSKQHLFGKNNRQYGNGKNQFNSYRKQPEPKNSWAGKRTKVTPDQRDEMGGRKTNLNHLLNFTFENEESLRTGPRVFSKSMGINRDVYNKEQFIQAKCQMIMKDGEDYTPHSVDADLIMDWDKVEKVNIWNKEIPTCPICLSDFCAARVTKCGHTYCWPCILHYLALDQRSWRKCPICHEAVHNKDLKSVSVYEDRNFEVHDVITMRLMKRCRGSTITVEAHQETTDHSFLLDETLSAVDQRNIKYLIASPEQILRSIVHVEKSQLEFKLATETDDFERTFVQSALELCKLRETALLEAITAAGTSTITYGAMESNKNDFASGGSTRETESVSCDQIIDNERIPDEDLAHDVMSPASDTDLNTSFNSPVLDGDQVGTDQSDENIYYFYQANDGQHIYLHPLNLRCLHRHYKSYGNCPPEICAKIVESEEFTMNETTRKRYRYLSHLPLSLEFRIAELDLRPPVVSMTTLSSFREAFDRRAGLRRKKARDEKRILRKAQNEALRKQGKYPSARICLENQHQFPDIQTNTPASFSVLLPPPGTTPSSESLVSSSSELSMSPDRNFASSSKIGPSFAEMLKLSKPEEQFSQARRHTAQCQSSAPVSANQDEEDDDYTAPPTYQSSFGDALCSALDNMASPSGGTSKKKKKGKKVLLFSTNSQHR